MRMNYVKPTEAQRQGSMAEQRVCWYLRWRGWRICARNWIGGGGELDIVASRWRTLLMVEVRQRTTTAAALASIDQAKLTRIMQATQALVRLHGLERYYLRYDAFGLDKKGSLLQVKDLLHAGMLGVH
jgi:putative endonuclease